MPEILSPRLRAYLNAVDRALADGGMDALGRGGVLRDLENQIADMRREQGMDDDALLARLDPPEAYAGTSTSTPPPVPVTAPDTVNTPGTPESAWAKRRSSRSLTIQIVHWVLVLIIAALLYFPVVSWLRRTMLDGNRRHGRYAYGYGRLSDMKQIGLGLAIWSAQNNGRYPRSLVELYDGGNGIVNDPIILAAPGDLENLGLYYGFFIERYNFLYPGADANAIPPNAPVIVYPYRTRIESDIRVTVLFGDGHVRLFPNFEAVLSETRPGGRP